MWERGIEKQAQAVWSLQAAVVAVHDLSESGVL